MLSERFRFPQNWLGISGMETDVSLRLRYVDDPSQASF